MRAKTCLHAPAKAVFASAFASASASTFFYLNVFHFVQVFLVLGG
jgi:hypothetical protein